ncbi:hypothetical protein GCM10010271_23180 [Streptomyces kurssanovii]|nr:hypothetical protein GCM10010271_23180 [Streptomyces kurssanovii]
MRAPCRQTCPRLPRHERKASEWLEHDGGDRALSCDDVSLFDNVMVIVRWRVERDRRSRRSLGREGRTDHAADTALTTGVDSGRRTGRCAGRHKARGRSRWLDSQQTV